MEEEYQRVSCVRARALTSIVKTRDDVIEKPDGLGRFHATSRDVDLPSCGLCAALACLGLRDTADTHRTGRPPTCRFYPRSLTARLETAEPINQYIYTLTYFSTCGTKIKKPWPRVGCPQIAPLPVLFGLSALRVTASTPDVHVSKRRSQLALSSLLIDAQAVVRAFRCARGRGLLEQGHRLRLLRVRKGDDPSRSRRRGATGSCLRPREA